MIGTSLALGILTGNPATEADKALLDAAGGPKALLERFRALGAQPYIRRKAFRNTL